MKAQLIKLNDYNIIVNDEDRIENDLIIIVGGIGEKLWSIHKSTKDVPFNNNYCRKVIASENSEHSLLSINYNDLEEEFGIVDVEKLFEKMNPQDGKCPKWVLELFKKSQSLNDKKFTLEDMKNAFNTGILHNQGEDLGNNGSNFNGLINKLQQPKVFDIEGEIENNSFKITKIIK